MPENSGTPPRPRRRLRELAGPFVRPTRGQLLVAVILLLCGLAVTVQFRTLGQQQDYSSLRRTELIAILDDLTAESRRLEAQVSELERTQSELRTGVDRQRVARDEVERRRGELAILSGTVPARGEGIRVVISGSSEAIRDSTLLDALEELRDAGAEVIEVNDQVRVVASTWVTAAAGEITMDGVGLRRPIILDAIGDPHALSEALSFRGGLVSQVSDASGKVEITQLDEVQISSVHTAAPPQYAVPA